MIRIAYGLCGFASVLFCLLSLYAESRCALPQNEPATGKEAFAWEGDRALSIRIVSDELDVCLGQMITINGEPLGLRPSQQLSQERDCEWGARHYLSLSSCYSSQRDEAFVATLSGEGFIRDMEVVALGHDSAGEWSERRRWGLDTIFNSAGMPTQPTRLQVLTDEYGNPMLLYACSTASIGLLDLSEEENRVSHGVEGFPRSTRRALWTTESYGLGVACSTGMHGLAILCNARDILSLHLLLGSPSLGWREARLAGANIDNLPANQESMSADDSHVYWVGSRGDATVQIMRASLNVEAGILFGEPHYDHSVVLHEVESLSLAAPGTLPSDYWLASTSSGVQLLTRDGGVDLHLPGNDDAWEVLSD